MSPARRSTHPSVCVVVLNHNGGPMTVECLEALLATDWPAQQLTVMLVDNASGDGIAARVRTELPEVRVFENTTNLGFAGGNNVALREVGDAEYVALINNDAIVAPDWLEPLVEMLERSPDLGAACPKILFRTPFREITVRSATRRRVGDRRALGVRVSGVTLDDQDAWADLQLVTGFWGPEHGAPPETQFQWTEGDARLRVPVPSSAQPAAHCEVRLATIGSATVEVTSADRSVRLTVGEEPTWYRIPLGGRPLDIVNNAGNELLDDEFGADRGYLQPDGEAFADPVDVFAWCGAAVLLRRDYLEDVGLFDERLFLYYEDLELSWRGQQRGWRYRFEPRSVVRHLHSATTGENSRLVDYYTARNRLLVLTRHAPFRQVGRSVTRELLVTASYARRDVFVPMLSRRAVNREVVGRRVHAFGGYLRRAPSMLRSRWRDRSRRHARDQPSGTPTSRRSSADGNASRPI